jgi:ribosomal protein S18 acetylase RimI-like enzyme
MMYWSKMVLLAGQSRKTFVKAAFDGQKLVGIVSASRVPWHASQPGKFHLDALYVDVAYQRHGIGKQLLSATMIHCEQFISNKMSVEVLSGDPVIRRWYERFGATYVCSGSAFSDGKPPVDFLVFKSLKHILRNRFGIEPQRKKLGDHICRLLR